MYDQIVSVVEAAKTASESTLSSSVLRRNLMDHDSPTKTIPPQLQCCVLRIVQKVRKQVTQLPPFPSATIYSVLD